MELNLELLRIAIALIGTAILAYQDYKTSFIDDKIVYAMIASGILLNLLTLDTTFIAFAIGGALLIAAIGYFFYKYGQFGAGDILLFAALHLLLPFPPLETAKALNATQLLDNAVFLQISQLLPFFFSIFTTAALLALFGSAALYAYKLHVKKTKWQPEKVPLFGISAVGLAFIAWFNTAYPLTLVQNVFFLLILAATVFSTAMKKQIMKEVIVQRIAIKEIEDEDILALEEIGEKMVKKYSLQRVLTRENVEKLKAIEKKEGTKVFPVYKNLPRFVPYVLAALVLSILLVNPLAYVLFS